MEEFGQWEIINRVSALVLSDTPHIEQLAMSTARSEMHPLM